MPVSAQISTSQLPLLQAKHISISEHTSNSRPIAFIIFSCCRCCCRLRRAECCIVWFNVLELVEDADLLRGRFTASCYALRARRSWHVGIRFSKSGHLERVEMIRSGQEVLGSVLAAYLDYRKIVEIGKSKASCRLLVLYYSPRRKWIRSTARCTFLPFHAPSPSNAPSVKNAKKKIPRRHFRLVQGDLL